jgi:hypothetical protein
MHPLARLITCAALIAAPSCTSKPAHALSAAIASAPAGAQIVTLELKRLP